MERPLTTPLRPSKAVAATRPLTRPLALGLTIADGGERFDAPNGIEHRRAGEVVWRDDVGVTCRPGTGDKHADPDD